MANLAIVTQVQVFDANGDPVPGAIVSLFESGTTTPKVVFADNDLSIPLGSVLVANAAGFIPAFFIGSGAVKAVIQTAVGATISTVDPVLVSLGAANDARQVGFEPTALLPFLNVQDAIEGVSTAASSGFAPFGLGITGNAALIANIDATNIPAGWYRYDNTTIGTFPPSTTAAVTGLVFVPRQSAGIARMALYPSNSVRSYTRRLQTTWQPWREEMTVNTSLADGDLFYQESGTIHRLPKGTAGQVLAMAADASLPLWAEPNVRAWGVFNGANGSIFSGRNVASVTRVSVGLYQVTFTTPAPFGTYAILPGMDSAGPVSIRDQSRATTGFRLSTTNAAGAAQDAGTVSFSVNW